MLRCACVRACVRERERERERGGERERERPCINNVIEILVGCFDKMKGVNVTKALS